jgi:hypothetical protein
VKEGLAESPLTRIASQSDLSPQAGRGEESYQRSPDNSELPLLAALGCDQLIDTGSVR